MTETILDEGAVSEIEAQAWKKGFPDLDGDYYCRVDEHDKQPTPIRIESRSASTSAAVYEFGCSDDLRREYEAEEDYEYLGPLNPESIPALCATVRHLRKELSTTKGHWANTSEDLASALLKHDDLQSQLEQLRVENERLKLSEDEVKVLTDYHYYESEKALTRRGDRASQHRHLERLAAMKSQYQGEM